MLVICTDDSIWGLPLRTKDKNVRCCVALIWYKPFNYLHVYSHVLLQIIQMRIFLRIWSIESIQVSDSNKILLIENLPGLLVYTTEFFMRFLCFPGIRIL